MKLHKVIGTFIFAAALPFSVQAESISSGEMVDVQVVDYSGKPPFKRRTVSLSVNDVAQLESVGEEAIDYVKVTEVIKHGKPPYRRKCKHKVHQKSITKITMALFCTRYLSTGFQNQSA